MSRISLIIGAFATVLTSASTQAQTSEKYLYFVDANQTTTLTKHSSAYVNKSMVNAMKHFTSTYGGNAKENWSVKPHGFRASFRKDGVVHLVDYNKKGNLSSTIRIYDESLLPKDVRNTVKSTYYDFDIVSVTELSLPENVVYFVKIQDESSLKTIRVMHGDMDVVEDFIRGDR